MKENIYIQLLPKNPKKWPFIAIYSKKIAKNSQYKLKKCDFLCFSLLNQIDQPFDIFRR